MVTSQCNFVVKHKEGEEIEFFMKYLLSLN